MSRPVTPARIAIASERLANADVAAVACREVGLPFWAACALLDKESNGENVWGHDQGGVFSNDEHDEVTAELYHEFIIKVMNGAISNGVGPCQITYAGSLVRCTGGNGRNGGYFREMSEEHLLPWDVHDNMVKGFTVLADHHTRHGSWFTAARLYNGGSDYGRDFVRVANEWRDRLNIQGGPVS